MKLVIDRVAESKNPRFKAPSIQCCFLPDPNKEVNHESAVICEKANWSVQIMSTSVYSIYV